MVLPSEHKQKPGLHVLGGPMIGCAPTQSTPPPDWLSPQIGVLLQQEPAVLPLKQVSNGSVQ
jgi:hypothetical protein